MNRPIALLLVAATSVNCATASAVRSERLSAPNERTAHARNQTDPALMAQYVRALRVGSKVKMALTDGTRLRAVLMAVGERDVTVRLRTRIPEAPRTIAFDQLVDVEVEKESGIGRAIAVGAAVGAASAISVFLMIIAALGD